MAECGEVAGWHLADADLDQLAQRCVRVLHQQRRDDMVRHDRRAELRDELIMLADRLRMAAMPKAVSGQQAYTTSGTYTFTVPAGVTSVSVVCVGGGQGSYTADASTQYSMQAGAGAGLAYKNNISVTPGSSYTVVVGSGGVGNNSGSGDSTKGGDSYFINTSTVLARGGGSATTQVGDATYTGGSGGSGQATTGGGGAAGYSGNGGSGAYSSNTYPSPASATAGAGGGGGGGGGGLREEEFNGDPDLIQFWGGGGGGGVGILGSGSNGAAGVSGYGATGGGGGSGGTAGSNSSGDGGPGGAYGGGGGSPGYLLNLGSFQYTQGAKSNGAVGAVRIIWGSGRSYPSNAANV